MLRELYGFWCNCPKCKRKEGQEGEDDMMKRNKESAEEMIEKMKSMPMFTDMEKKGESDIQENSVPSLEGEQRVEG